jgi:glycosyltransferase involved in cell wall biosynthesis
VTFTGFLDPDGEYVGLLRGVDVAMVLTTRDHTLQLAGCEAIAVGTPLITSDWAYLRTLFAGGTVFTGHSPDAIAKAVTEAVERRGQLAAEIPALRELRHREWQQQLRALRRAVESTHGAEAEDVAIRTDEGPALASGRPGRGFDER